MKKRVVSFSFFIALVLLSSTFMVYQDTVVIGDSQGVSVIQEDLVERFRPSYEDHAPISITGDENLTKMAEQNAWDGEGTLEEPYIIEGYNISLSGTPGSCITLYDISLYVVLRDCFIGNATWGIYLVNVTRFSSIGNIIYGNGFGMYTLLCDHSIIMDTIFEEDYYGIYVEKAMNVHIEGCQFIKSWAAIDACDLVSSWIVDNTITDVEYGIVLEPSCIDNEVRQNSISEASSIGIIISLASEYNKIVLNCLNSDSWGAYDDSAGTTNVFSHNYYSDYTSIDVDEDGVYDIPHLIPGVSGVYDYHPLRYEPLSPSWAYAPVDFEMELGSSCFRQLQVNSYPPIAHWVVNDTLHFEIDHNGVLLDRGNLVLGEYGLEVNVTDLYGQSVTGVFKVTVVDSAYPVFVMTLEDIS
ncbi:MAG: NosD domain-containing protein, partial [Candidatus Thorarchaeota archaeon]